MTLKAKVANLLPTKGSFLNCEFVWINHDGITCAKTEPWMTPGAFFARLEELKEFDHGGARAKVNGKLSTWLLRDGEWKGEVLV